MGLLDKLLNKDDGHADKETGDWLSKLDDQITESTVQPQDFTSSITDDDAPLATQVPKVLTTAEFSGPTGNINDHLQTLDVLPGASWSQISMAHKAALGNLGAEATVSERRRINCAYAALRVHGENTAF